MIIKATYVGKTTNDYKNGEVYELITNDVCIRKVDFTARMEFKTLVQFLKYFNNITIK